MAVANTLAYTITAVKSFIVQAREFVLKRVGHSMSFNEAKNSDAMRQSSTRDEWALD